MVRRRLGLLAAATAGTAIAGLLAPAGAYADVASVPVPTAGPRVIGASNVGQTLTADPGTWTSASPYTVSYAWQRCRPNGVCETIPGATASTYTVTAADHWYASDPNTYYWGRNWWYGYPYRLQALVTATNAAGAATRTATAPTPVIENDVIIGGPTGGFDTMIENGRSKPMDWRFDPTYSPWKRHCPGMPTTTEPQRLGWVPSDQPGAGAGNQAIRFEIQDGDIDPITKLPDRQRCSIISYNQLREGADTWTRFQVKLAADFPFDPTWNEATKWYRWQGIWGMHLGVGGTSGPVALSVRSDTTSSGHFELVDGSEKDPTVKMGPNLDQNDNWIRWKSGTIQLDHWYDVVIHMVTSKSDSIGRMELWVDGEHQVLRNDGYRRTTVGDDFTYPQFGLYRDSTIRGTSTAYGDGYRMGLTPQSVGCTPDATNGVVCAAA